MVEYLERIQATLDPFGGRFLVHGPTIEIYEGSWPGSLVIIEFPDVEHARAWYASEAYQAILHLRTDHIDGATLIADGVGPDYDPAKMAGVMRHLLSSRASAPAS